jgi:hypothetical protein
MAGVTKSKEGKTCGTYEGEKTYRVLVGKPEGIRLLATPRRRWEDIMMTAHNEVR